MKAFQINFSKLAFLTTPTMLRGKKLMMFITSLVYPLSPLHGDFLKHREDNIYKIKHTGQVCYLRKVLNDAFLDRNKSFQIEDSARTGNWLYARDKDLTNHLMLPQRPSGLLFWHVDAITAGASGFVVIIPDNFDGDIDVLNQIKSIVNQYKLLSKQPYYTYG